ncbi:MAG: aldehyde-activating protein [Gammaproteobacteria bacterium]|nr:aldehyde-activating protein [Gammaproteobacteria bacterium]
MTEGPSSIEGACHCGAIGFTFHASAAPASWTVRACQCGFCRAHGARTTSDPQGSVAFRIREGAKLRRYRFASKSADFLVCADCGVYVAAVLTSPAGQFATLNVNVMAGPPPVPEAAPVTYDEESPAEKRARRERRWTPVRGPV